MPEIFLRILVNKIQALFEQNKKVEEYLPKQLEGVVHQVMRINPQLARKTGIFKLVNKLFVD